MVKFTKIIILAGMSFFFLFSQPAIAKDKVRTEVKVIHASTKAKGVDSSLKNISHELESVFKYTSYRLIKNKRLNQGFNEKGQVKIPGKRTLIVTPSRLDGKRIRYQINIRKNNRSIFQTQVLLKNNKSITIGGPQYKKGVLLFNISGSLQ